MCLGYKYFLKIFLFALWSTQISTQAMYNDDQDLKENRKCFEGLGCVRLTSDWVHPKYRPINLLPANRHAVNTIFVQWTLSNGILTPNIIGTAKLQECNIKSCLKILVHDFTSNGYTGWIQHLSRAFLSNSDLIGWNIVSVDWAAGAEPPYAQAVANARLVALEIVYFLNCLKNNLHLKRDQVHIIGHGVGAHIAGYVGKMKRIRRITALDPSGPYFQSMPPNVRLHEKDAKFIEVVHSDAATYGQGNLDLLGHVDYFPNGGREQPGCVDLNLKVISLQRSDLKLGQTFSACSHKRSIKYYIESLVNPSCSFLGIACDSYKDFVKGRCTTCGDDYENCSRLHPLSRPRKLTNRAYFFVTSDSSPFCGEILKVLLVLRSKYCDQRFVNGYFNVTIPQSIGNVSFFLNENHPLTALRANDHHVFVVFRSTPPTLKLPATEVHVKWLHGPLPCSWCTPPKITSFMIYKLSGRRNEMPQWFCPVSGSAAIGLGFAPCQQDATTTTTEMSLNRMLTEEDSKDDYENVF